MPNSRLLRFFHIAILILTLASLGWGAYKAVRFLLHSPHLEVQKISTSGLKRVSQPEVLSKTGEIAGRNIFMLDLDGIRVRVEQLEWVRHAAVQRVLPDQVAIRVTERQPIGLARIGGETFYFDVDAAILEPDAEMSANFPVLDGLRPGDIESNARKVGIYGALTAALPASEMSEVHINDIGEVSVVSNSDPVMIFLGTEDFRMRWLKYIQLSAQIKQQYPQVTGVDLRFRNQVIIRTGAPQAPEDVIWDAKKKTL